MPGTVTTSPFFLVGSERSGTSMFRLILDHHPQIGCFSEFEYAVDFINDPENWPALEAYYAYLENNRIYQSSENRYQIDKSLTYPNLIRSFLDQFRQRRPDRTAIGATVHTHFDRLTRIWPDAKFIYIYRDGRDVARSCMGMGWAGNLWTASQRWIDAEQLWAQFRPTLDPERCTEIQFEELLARPEEELTRICAFLGVPYDASMLSYPDDSTYEPPDPKLCYQWKRKLSPEELQLVEFCASGRCCKPAATSSAGSRFGRSQPRRNERSGGRIGGAGCDIDGTTWAPPSSWPISSRAKLASSPSASRYSNASSTSSSHG